LKRWRTLAVSEQYDKVKQFLISKSRKSEQTKRVYSFALSHFQTFLQINFENYDIETVLTALEQKTLNVYSLLDNFVGYLELRQDASNSNTKLSSQSILLYVAGVQSYLEYYDIDISLNKFKSKVTLPSKHKPVKEALDAEDIRTILLNCTNVRLKAFLLVLASSALRANEATCLRNSDIDFSISPTKIHIRAENTKTKQARDVYVSEEASKELKRFIDSKGYKNPNDLIFSRV
jgi:integrase